MVLGDDQNLILLSGSKNNYFIFTKLIFLFFFFNFKLI
jgi:hypothetical protein